VGDTLSLFAAGAALLALLIASYSRRSTWIVLGSTTMSMAALVGCLFLSTIQDPSQVRTRLAWIASKLPLVLDRQIAADLAAAIEPIPASSPCEAGQSPGCRATASEDSLPARPEAVQAASTTSWFGGKPESKSTSDSPVAWRLGEPQVQVSSSGAVGFLIGGTNVSDQDLKEVHAVLKPDSSQRELELALDVEGHKFKDGTVIPAGARFSLVFAVPSEDGAKQFGGAILTFRYVQAGQRKTSILYLTASMVSRFANRG
jgi:hypothetical protein